MDSPDKVAESSTAAAGDVHPKPERPVAVVVTDEDNEPAGVLEKWSSEGWIYADADSLEQLN
jgi:hypothetical protein